jgi:hypothetical protein
VSTRTTRGERIPHRSAANRRDFVPREQVSWRSHLIGALAQVEADLLETVPPGLDRHRPAGPPGDRAALGLLELGPRPCGSVVVGEDGLERVHAAGH